MSDDRLDAIERRLDAVESVLVALACWAHGSWGPLRNGYLAPGEASSPYNRGNIKSPFEAIASLFKPKDKPET